LKGKHLRIARDSELLKHIYRQVNETLVIDGRKYRLRIWTKFIFYFSFSAASYSLLYIVGSPLGFVLSYMLYGFVSVLFAFNFSHDFSHNTVFKSKRLNNFCFIMVYAIIGAHGEAWKQRHVNAHHYAPNVKGYDPDLKIAKIIRVVPGSEYFWYHAYQHIYAPVAYTIYSLFWVFIKDFVILFSEDEYTENKGLMYHLSFWAQKGFYITFILTLPLLLSGQVWYVVLLGFLLMHSSQSLFLLFTFFMTHHVEKTAYPTTDENGRINTSWLMNQVHSSNDMHPFSQTANFIFGGFNNHVAHHLFPHVHHIYYPELSRVLYGILLENGIVPNHTTYWGGLVSHLKLLKRMGTEPSPPST
jgi:linoleoyl-CoA desaturase